MHQLFEIIVEKLQQGLDEMKNRRIQLIPYTGPVRPIYEEASCHVKQL